jgi:DNA ligase-1
MKPDIKPMLAAPIRPEKGESLAGLRFPVIASPKIDGIRCLVIDEVPHSRSLKPIPNRHVAGLLRNSLLNCLDGELLIGDGSDFQSVTSGIMSRDGEPDFTYHVFDHFASPNDPYEKRIGELHGVVSAAMRRLPFVRLVRTEFIRDLTELEDFTEKCLSEGYEGAMVRNPLGPYKFGRATFKEGYLTKVKPFEDDEATVVGFEEQLENRNESTTNELGRTARSSHQANLFPKGTLGALVLNHPAFGEFNIGTGFDSALRQKVWNNRSAYLGKQVKFRYQTAGMKDKPRIPSFKGFRHTDDL